jgi:hypothetical protein
LVITLAALVLLSAILLVFFSQSTINRQLSSTSAGQYRADVAAQTALNTVIGDLRTEIMAGSKIQADPSGTNIYWPTNNLTVVPCQTDLQGYSNLIKQSTSGTSSWSGVGYDSTFSPIRSAVNNSTDAASLNGRSIPVAEWNRPGLLGDPGINPDPESAPVSSKTGNPYAPPDWAILTRQGALTNATLPSAIALTGNGSLSDRSPGNLNYAIGRYAFAIYDEGGLLDVSVAGFPNTLSGTDFSTKRGLLPQVDLAALLANPAIGDGTASDDAEAFVNWRNAATAAISQSYTNYVFGATNGFTSVAPGDQGFIGRQDLISYVQGHSSQFPSAALPYVTTFTRSLNSPSFAPNSSRPHVQDEASDPPQNPSSPTFGLDDQFNPSLINTRVISSFLRYSDGASAIIGEPLLKYRFPLSHLALFGNNNSATGDANSDIYKFFGLTRSSSTAPWIYRNGAATVLNLSQVAAAKREPDFFELLQAGIMVGSLGMSGNLNNTTSFANTALYDSNVYNHIIQIGANLMDQYDTDSLPTAIQFNGTVFYGVENLPYIANVFESAYELHDGNPQDYSMWYQPQIWNPHVPRITTAPAGTVPTEFRFVTSGTAFSFFQSPAQNSSSNNNTFPISNTSGIIFSTSSQNFNTPLILDSSNGASALDPNDAINETGVGGSKFLGIWVGFINNASKGNSTTVYSTAYAGIPVKKSVTHLLQYSVDGGSTWLPSSVNGVVQGYSQVKNVQSHSTYLNQKSFLTLLQGLGEGRSDPRTDRFGVANGVVTRPSNSDGAYSFVTAASAGWTLGGVQQGYPTVYLGALSDNKPASTTHYADPDRTIRPGDGAYTDGNLSDGGYPLATDSFNDTSSRPVILDRPFRSVAEMGYAFRDEPWKHLDFFTANSGDAALLDLFCVNGIAAASNNDPVPEAGKLNLNTHQPIVLETVFTGAIKAEDDTTSISTSEAEKLATSLGTVIAAGGPLWNRSELVTRWISDPGVAGYSSTPADAVVKRRREAAVRALADIGDTRTWNLLIDLIAQSGRYPTSAKDLNQFVVEGERRYWLHVAIDRYTGRIISQYLEPVSE